MDPSQTTVKYPKCVLKQWAQFFRIKLRKKKKKIATGVLCASRFHSGFRINSELIWNTWAILGNVKLRHLRHTLILLTKCNASTMQCTPFKNWVRKIGLSMIKTVILSRLLQLLMNYDCNSCVLFPDCWSLTLASGHPKLTLTTCFGKWLHYRERSSWSWGAKWWLLRQQ